MAEFKGNNNQKMWEAMGVTNFGTAQETSPNANRANATNAYTRALGLPLDLSSVHASYTDAVVYAATKGIAYQDQIIAAEGVAYIIVTESQGKLEVSSYRDSITGKVVTLAETTEYDIYIKPIGIIPGLEDATVGQVMQVATVEGKKTLTWATLPEVVESTGGAVSVTKKTDGNYELDIKISEEENNILSNDYDPGDGINVGGLYVPAVSYAEGTQATVGETAETVDVLVDLSKDGVNTLRGHHLGVYTKYGVEKRIAEAGHMRAMTVTKVDGKKYYIEDQEYDAQFNVLYLVYDKDATGTDRYLEYILVTDPDGGEPQNLLLIGDTSTNLSDYYNKDDIDTLATDTWLPNAVAAVDTKFTTEYLPLIGEKLITVSDDQNILAISHLANSNPVLNFNFDNSGNVQFESTETGLKANVTIPDITIPIERGELEVIANTAFVIQQIKVDENDNHKIIETPIEVVTKDILVDAVASAGGGKVDPTKVYAKQIVWKDLGGGSEQEYEHSTLDAVLSQLAYATKSDGGVIIGTAGLMSANDKYKLDKLVIGDDGEVGISGTISAENVTGLNDRIVSIVTGNTADQLGIETGAQVNKIEKIKLGGLATELAIAGADKSVTIPLATNSQPGLAKSASGVNQISYNSEGQGEINFVSANKLVQLAGTELILFGGQSNAFTTLIPIIQDSQTYYIDLKAEYDINTWAGLHGAYPSSPEGYYGQILIREADNKMILNVATAEGEVETEYIIQYTQDPNGKGVYNTDLIYTGPYYAYEV